MNVFGSGAPSSAGRASGGRSVGVGLPSACSSLGVLRFDGECLLLVQADLNEGLLTQLFTSLSPLRLQSCTLHDMKPFK